MKHIFFILILLIFFSCQKNAKYKTSDWSDFERQLSILKNNRKDSVNLILVNNFKFGMTKDEVVKLKDSLIQKGILDKYSDKIKIYETRKKELNNNENIEKIITGIISLDYENNKLNNLNIDIEKSDFKNALKIFTSFYSTPDLFLDKGKYGTKYAWIIENQEITISYNYGFPKINYYDYTSVNPEEMQRRKEEFARRSYVGNDDYNGSVKQVIAYLKENLKDTRSYESISWSKVMHKDGYYLVRHKYRAKNSYGGNVIENKLFYIDLYGDVYKIEDFNN